MGDFRVLALCGRTMLGMGGGFLLGAILIGPVVFLVMLYAHLAAVLLSAGLDLIFDMGFREWWEALLYHPDWSDYVLVGPIVVCGCIGAVLGAIGAAMSARK